MRSAWIAGFLLIYGGVALLHWAAWRWLAQAAPQWMARQRRAKLAVFVVLFCLPIARVAAFVRPPAPPIFSIIAAAGMLWHLGVAMTMAVIGLVRAGRAL